MRVVDGEIVATEAFTTLPCRTGKLVATEAVFILPRRTGHLWRLKPLLLYLEGLVIFGN